MPIMEHMPKNCSADVQAVTAHIDKAFMSKDEKETARILQMFDMTTLADHLDDVVGAIWRERGRGSRWGKAVRGLFRDRGEGLVDVHARSIALDDGEDGIA